MKYIVTGEITISCSTIVEASSVKEAKRLALQRGNGSIVCNGRDEEQWCADELDGEASITGTCELDVSDTFEARGECEQ